MFSRNVVIACVLFAVCQALPRGETIAEWHRETCDEDGHHVELHEHAELVGDRQILMNSDSDDLKQIGFYRSQSFHDFNTGVLAIKYVPYGEEKGKGCFIGTVAKSFEETYKELRSRKGGIPSCGHGKHYKVVEQIKETKSRATNQFCEGMPIYQMKPAQMMRGYDDKLSPIKPWIVRTLCIWINIDIWFPVEVPIEDDFFYPIIRI